MPPIPLEYQKPMEPTYRPRWWLFAAGVVAGWLLIAFAFMTSSATLPTASTLISWQFITGVMLCPFNRPRPFGIGLIISIPVAGLIVLVFLAIADKGWWI